MAKLFLMLIVTFCAWACVSAICQTACTCNFSKYSGCIERISLKVKTATRSNAQTNDRHKLEIKLKYGSSRSVRIPCNYGSNCAKGTTTVFDFDIDEFYIGKPACIKPYDIKEIALAEGGNDGWYPASIYTTFSLCGSAVPGTYDDVFNKWVDGNQGSQEERQRLTIVY